jgi:hypothetical protein
LYLVELQLESIALFCAVLCADGRAIHVHEHKGGVIGDDNAPLRVEVLELALGEPALPPWNYLLSGSTGFLPAGMLKRLSVPAYLEGQQEYTRCQSGNTQ